MTLILLPNLLDESAQVERWLSADVAAVVQGLQGVIAESEKGARAFLRRFRQPLPPVALLNEHTIDIALEELLDPLMRGERWGLLSDAGLPIIADPGAPLVALARQKGIQVEALSGPSAPLLALMLSGLPAQRFAFHGYLAKEHEVRRGQILDLERRSAKEGATQLFIEAPYRTEKLAAELIALLQPTTRLCMALSLTGQNEQILCQPIFRWRMAPQPVFGKQPAIFLIAAG